MSYTLTRNGVNYNFDSYDDYKTFWNDARKYGRAKGINTAQAFAETYGTYLNNKNTSTSETNGDYSKLVKYANDYKDSAYANASALRGASYEAALKARQESEALAEIQRKRGIVDASTMAEQQKATYGANAEQLGRMGLNVSGYSDYLNSQAYATGMAYRQAANAQATDIKRQATYQEALARLEADKAYSQATAEADKTYYGAMKEIEAAKIADAKANVTLTDKQIDDLTATRDAQMIAKDYVGAAKTNAQITYPNATPEQLKLYESADIVSMMDTISSDPSSWSSIANNLANYGDNGAKNIKEAFSNSEYVSSAESLGKNELKAVIDSGLLTDEAQSKLESLYATKFEEKNQTSAYSTDVFGKYSNPEKVSAAQSDYADAIVEAAKNGKINESDIVAVVLNSNSQKYYKYVGGNKFEEVSETMVKYSSDANVVTIDGYEITRVDKGSTVPYYSWKVTKKK